MLTQEEDVEIHALAKQGWTISEIARHTGRGRKTIRAIHPHSISQTFNRIVKRAEVPRIRLHDLRVRHGTLLIKAGIPVKVVSERLGHGNPTFTIDTYQHILPGMQAEAARMFESLIVPEASTG
jgi:integrase